MLITKRRKLRNPKLTIDGVDMDWKRKLTYLEVDIDKEVSFGPHTNEIALKAFKTIGNLSRLMPNIGGRKQRKKKIASVTTSQMLYAAPVWKELVEKKPYLKRLFSVHRCAALRIISPYRTVPESSSLVLAGTPPIDLLIIERSEVYKQMENCFLESTDRVKEMTAIKENARARLIES